MVEGCVVWEMLVGRGVYASYDVCTLCRKEVRSKWQVLRVISPWN